jgi:hypothetical protein
MSNLLSHSNADNRASALKQNMALKKNEKASKTEVL